MAKRLVLVFALGLALSLLLLALMMGLSLGGCARLFPMMRPLIPEFSASPTFGEAPLEVRFQDLSQSDPARPITSWEWAFGDGAKSTATDPTHIYEAPGSYTVSLTISDGAGRKATATKPDYISVQAKKDDEPEPEEPPALPPTLGSPQAKVTVLEFSDYLCPYCAKFASLTLPQLEADYIATGKARLVFRSFPVHGDPAVLAALAGLCAHEQGRFWEYHDRLFSISLNEGGKALEDAGRLKKVAAELGLDEARFDDLCLASRKYARAIQDDIAEGERLGVEGTPTFFINGRKILGAQPYETFKRVIEEELAKPRGEGNDRSRADPDRHPSPP
ncbi:MAG: thioredoxin domain-containing protein [Candidatus Bipolaricaulia bacterium]